MIKYDDVTRESMNENNLNWPQIPDHPYIIWIIAGSEFRKTNALINLIKWQSDDFSIIVKFIYTLRIQIK